MRFCINFDARALCWGPVDESGKHPGLVVHKLESLAAKFLYDQVTDEEEESIPKEDMDYIFDQFYADNIL